MSKSQKPIRVLENELYIEPTSVCNLHCKMCYTNVINGPEKKVLSSQSIMDLVRRFADATPGPLHVYWCGTGEIFLHKEFPRMANEIVARYGDAVTQTVQTNGTIDRLAEFDTLRPIKFHVSIDGMQEAHEWHRGEKTYDKTLDFCRAVLDRDCRGLTIRMLLMRDNIETLDEFHAELVLRLGPRFELSPMVPFDNRVLSTVRQSSLGIVRDDIDDSKALSEREARSIMAVKYGSRYSLEEDAPAVTKYMSLNTYGVHSCCNGIVKLGDHDTDVALLRQRLTSSHEECRACSLFPCM